MLHGTDLDLPPTVAAGLEDATQRQNWNETADPAYGLPRETWREHVSRRKWIVSLRSQLRSGEVTDSDKLVTLNLDLAQFAEDVITLAEGPVVRAIPTRPSRRIEFRSAPTPAARALIPPSTSSAASPTWSSSGPRTSCGSTPSTKGRPGSNSGGPHRCTAW